jgi:hypothetical protein
MEPDFEVWIEMDVGQANSAVKQKILCRQRNVFDVVGELRYEWRITK